VIVKAGEIQREEGPECLWGGARGRGVEEEVWAKSLAAI